MTGEGRAAEGAGWMLTIFGDPALASAKQTGERSTYTAKFRSIPNLGGNGVSQKIHYRIECATYWACTAAVFYHSARCRALISSIVSTVSKYPSKYLTGHPALGLPVS